VTVDMSRRPSGDAVTLAAGHDMLMPTGTSGGVGYIIDTNPEFADTVTTGAIAINDLSQVLKVDANGDLAITEAENMITAKIVLAGWALTGNAGISPGVNAWAPNAMTDPLCRPHRVATASQGAPQTTR
jgi:hypothetical protein